VIGQSLVLCSISIYYLNNNFAYNNLTAIPIDKETSRRRGTTAEKRISIIGKKKKNRLQKLPRNCRNHWELSEKDQSAPLPDIIIDHGLRVKNRLDIPGVN
jgi:hypothetical protein